MERSLQIPILAIACALLAGCGGAGGKGSAPFAEEDESGRAPSRLGLQLVLGTHYDANDMEDLRQVLRGKTVTIGVAPWQFKSSADLDGGKLDDLRDRRHRLVIHMSFHRDDNDSLGSLRARARSLNDYLAARPSLKVDLVPQLEDEENGRAWSSDRWCSTVLSLSQVFADDVERRITLRRSTNFRLSSGWDRDLLPVRGRKKHRFANGHSAGSIKQEFHGRSNEVNAYSFSPDGVFAFDETGGETARARGDVCTEAISQRTMPRMSGTESLLWRPSFNLFRKVGGEYRRSSRDCQAGRGCANAGDVLREDDLRAIRNFLRKR